MSARQLKRVVISRIMLAEMLKTGTSWTVESGLPELALVKREVYDPHTDMYSLIFEAPSFDEVPEGSLIPIHIIVIRKA